MTKLLMKICKKIVVFHLFAKLNKQVPTYLLHEWPVITFCAIHFKWNKDQFVKTGFSVAFVICC